MSDNQTRTVVTVHKAGITVNDTITYEADWFSVEDGTLTVEREIQGQYTSGGFAVAAWAPGTWVRAEVTEEPAPIQDECSAPAGEFVPDEEMAEQIARAHYDAIDPYEDSRARGPESLANKLYAAALDGLRA
ncbi:hypothetical protein ACLQ3K_22015 [Tsukamurella sp. DT100]|uniref:hypothetical protein n=1 Tax=Tsukamurella sp. DT100 TaxID=3393415 RepID=UPI003CEA3D0E